VRLRQDAAQLDQVGDAQPSVSQRLDELREPTDQLRRHPAVARHGLGQAQLVSQKQPQARVPELRPTLKAIEVRQAQDEFDQGISLLLEQSTQLARTVGGRRWAHVLSVSCDERTSRNAAQRVTIGVRLVSAKAAWPASNAPPRPAPAQWR